MVMRQSLIYTLLCLGLAACGGKRTTPVESPETSVTDSIVEEQVTELPPLEEGEIFLKDKDPFGEVIELQGTHIVEPDTFIFRPSAPNMLVEDNLLIMQNGDAPFYIFHFPEFTYMKTIGRCGNGPDEFQFPFVVKSLNPDYLCYLCERTRGKLYGLDREFRIHYINEIFKATGGWGFPESIYAIGKNSFVYPKGRYIFRATLNGDSVITDKIFNLTIEHAKKIPVTGEMNVNPLRNRIVYAYKYAQIIKFMDMECKTIRTLNFRQSEFKEETLHIADGLDANVTYYMQVLPTRDYVYITYSGRTPYKVAADNAKKNYYMYVEQYDWNGNPIKKYRLDAFAVFTTIDAKTNKLILTVYDYDDPFVVYQL